MKRFYIITNWERDRELKVTNALSDKLLRAGCTVDKHVSRDEINGVYTDPGQIPEDVECVIVIGGDGTLIAAARDTIGLSLPILGINAGKLGFLTDVEPDMLDEAVDALKNDRCHIEERMMLNGYVKDRGGNLKCQNTALNDVVINRKGSLRVVEYGVWVNDKFLSSFRADGIIICTPTGSTGYSLSAGGPIIEPKSHIICITPICPHTLNTRSIVLSDENIIRIETSDRETEVNFDGRVSFSLEASDSVEIARSKHSARIMRINEESFLTILSDKFKK
ncbi:MAG: NAD(+)/NADH kinase [Lachnospiraceae bacterium]|nr:NAD(+)/NADH kinase [Lachnospiraceae bacterium]